MAQVSPPPPQALFVLDVAQSRARDIVCLATILTRPRRRGGRKRILAPDGKRDRAEFKAAAQ
jgi:hypothetical protein